MLAHRTMIGAARSRGFTAPGTYTFTVPTGVTTIMATVVSGGGYGGVGSGSPNFYLGGGGGSGAGVYASRTVTAGQTLSVVVGAGGSSFNDGDPSRVTHNASGNILQATGGKAGGTTSGSTGGAGGAGGTFSAAGLWSVISSQAGVAGNQGQPQSNGAGGVFPTFRSIDSSTGIGSGFLGMPDATPSGQPASGIVILEW